MLGPSSTQPASTQLQDSIQAGFVTQKLDNTRQENHSKKKISEPRNLSSLEKRRLILNKVGLWVFALSLLFVVLLAGTLAFYGFVQQPVSTPKYVTPTTKNTIKIKSTETNLSWSPTTTLTPLSVNPLNLTSTSTLGSTKHYPRLYYAVPEDNLFVVEGLTPQVVIPFSTGNAGHISLGGQRNIYGDAENLWIADPNGFNPKKLMDLDIWTKALGKPNSKPAEYVFRPSTNSIIVIGYQVGDQPPEFIIDGFVEISAESGRIISIINKEITASDFQFSPDGNLIIISEPDEISLMSVESGEKEELFRFPNREDTTNITFRGHFAWALDSKAIYMALSNPEQTQTEIYRITLDGQSSLIISLRIAVENLSISPDGQILVGCNQDATQIVELSSLRVSPLNTGGKAGPWSPDARKFIVIGSNTSRIIDIRSEALSTPMENGETTQIIWIDHQTVAYILIRQGTYYLYLQSTNGQPNLITNLGTKGSEISLYSFDIPPELVRLILEKQNIPFQSTPTLMQTEYLTPTEVGRIKIGDSTYTD